MNLMANKTKNNTALPFPVYFWTVAFLTTAGLADSIYLAISHYRVYTDVAYSSFCAISKAINCDTVSQSSYSFFLNVPVAVWGIIGYSFFLLFLPFARKAEAHQQRIWPLLFLLSLAFSIYSIILAFISAFHIHSYCIMCILSFGICFFLLYYTWLISKRFGNFDILHGLMLDIDYLWRLRKKALPVFLPFLSFVFILFIVFPAYWKLSPALLPKDMLHGLTQDGYPWIGAQNPKLEITEFTDYQCFQCKKMHFFLRQLIAKHPDKIGYKYADYMIKIDDQSNNTAYKIRLKKEIKKYTDIEIDFHDLKAKSYSNEIRRKYCSKEIEETVDEILTDFDDTWI